MSNTASNLRPVRVYHRPQRPKEGGGFHYPSEIQHEIASFHQFGTDYEEFENGPGPFPIAVIELPDGSVITPRADMIQFLDAAGA